MSPDDLAPHESVELLRRLNARIDDLLLLQHIALMGPERETAFVYRDVEVRFYLPYAARDHIQRVILKTGSFYEVGQLEKLVPLVEPGAVIVDAGANIGNHSVFFAKVLGASRVISFEPMHQTHRILARNAELNAPQVITTINAALGAESGTVRLSGYRSHNMGATTVRPDDAGAYKLTTIDSLELERLDFLKIDVEGGQVPLLRGAEKTLHRCRPLIWVELHASEYASGDAALAELGYGQRMAVSRSNFIYGPLT